MLLLWTVFWVTSVGAQFGVTLLTASHFSVLDALAASDGTLEGSQSWFGLTRLARRAAITYSGPHSFFPNRALVSVALTPLVWLLATPTQLVRYRTGLADALAVVVVLNTEDLSLLIATSAGDVAWIPIADVPSKSKT